MDKTLFAILLGGVLLNNYALPSFLGVTTFLGASRDTKKLPLWVSPSPSS